MYVAVHRLHKHVTHPLRLPILMRTSNSFSKVRGTLYNLGSNSLTFVEIAYLTLKALYDQTIVGEEPRIVGFP